MAKKVVLNKESLLMELERIKYEKEEGEDIHSEQMNIEGALLTLAKINPEKEYELCHAVAEHLLETVPEPDDIDLMDE